MNPGDVADAILMRALHASAGVARPSAAGSGWLERHRQVLEHATDQQEGKTHHIKYDEIDIECLI